MLSPNEAKLFSHFFGLFSFFFKNEGFLARHLFFGGEGATMYVEKDGTEQLL